MKRNQFILQNIVSGIAMLLLAITLFFPDLITSILGVLKQEIASYGYWNLVIIVFVSAIESFPFLGVLLPTLPIMLVVGGFYASIGGQEAILTILFASLGAFIGNTVGYFLGKKYGEKWIREYGLIFGIGNIELQWIQKKFIGHFAGLILIFGKFHGFTRSFVPFVAGISSFGNVFFWIYNTIGSFFWAAAIIGIGVFFSQNYTVILDSIGYIILGIICAVLFYFYFFQKESFLRYFRNKSEEMDNFYR